MSKRHITHQQKVRIEKLQQRRLHRLQERAVDELSDNRLGPEQEGLLVAHYGVFVDIEAQDGSIYRCNIRQNLGILVPGDRVVWRPGSEMSGVLVAVMPRRTLLTRTVGPGKTKPIAANLDRVILVIAPQPKPAANLIDSYIVAIESLGLHTMLVCNKNDLLIAEPDADLLQQLAIYQQIGYPVLFVSAKQKEGLNGLVSHLREHTSIFVGQSGVGKSSLIACLLLGNQVRVDIASPASDHGVHTTTTARLYHLPNGGELVDSPGVRDFILWDMPIDEIAKGFVEFRPFLGRCRFRDCRHEQNADCALHQAVVLGKISAMRLASYQRIVEGLQR